MPKLENEQFHFAILNVFDCEWKTQPEEKLGGNGEWGWCMGEKLSV